MFNTASRYTRRVWELDLLGALQHAWMRFYNELSLWSQSFWWDLVSRKGMSDADLLANTTRKRSSVDALLDHLGCQQFCKQEGRSQIDIERVVPILDTGIDDLFNAGNASVVDQNIHRAKVG